LFDVAHVLNVSARRMLQQFTANTAQQYEPVGSLCTMKVHLLEHLPDMVEWYGPLSSYWVFGLENYLGVVRRTLHAKSEFQLCFAKMAQSISTLSLVEQDMLCYMLDCGTDRGTVLEVFTSSLFLSHFVLRFVLFSQSVCCAVRRL
jgi:hypothetical protein